MESSALGLGGERRGRGWGWEEVDEGVGEEVPGSSLRPNICQTSTHTHLGNQVGARGLVATACARSELTAGCFAWKKRSLVNPAGVKFHRALTCNDITKRGTHLPLCPATQPSPTQRSRAALVRQPNRVSWASCNPGHASHLLATSKMRALSRCR